MESVLTNLGLLDDNSKICEEHINLVDKLSHLQQKFNVKELNSNALCLSYADKLKKGNNYSARLKICIKMYMQLNEALTKKNKLLKRFFLLFI